MLVLVFRPEPRLEVRLKPDTTEDFVATTEDFVATAGAFVATAGDFAVPFVPAFRRTFSVKPRGPEPNACRLPAAANVC